MIPIREHLADSRAFRSMMHVLFRRRGSRAVAHFLRGHLVQDRTILIDDFDGDIRIFCHLNEHMGSQLFWHGSYSSGQLSVLDGILRDGMTFVDVGANQGEFSLFAAKRLPHGRVIAFEPMTEMFERLNRNVEVNGFQTVQTVKQGLWSEPSRHELYWSDERFSDGSFHEGLGTVFPSAARSTPVEEIECTSLDEFVEANQIRAIDVVKIDVEGSELHVLSGASEALARFRPVLIMEADRTAAADAGIGLDPLLDFVESRYSVEVISRNGGTQPMARTELGSHQNLLCRPK